VIHDSDLTRLQVNMAQQERQHALTDAAEADHQEAPLEGREPSVEW
jgi:hypothetical protein